MLGHILRSPENSPAALSLTFAIEGAKTHKGRIGRHKINLLKQLRDDLKSMPIDRTSEYAALRQRPTLRRVEDIVNLRMLALNRQLWRDIYDFRVTS